MNRKRLNKVKTVEDPGIRKTPEKRGTRGEDQIPDDVCRFKKMNLPVDAVRPQLQSKFIADATSA